MSCGAISLSIASHLLAMLASKSNRPVMLPVRCAMLVTNPEPIGVDQSDETDRNHAGLALECSHDGGREGKDHVRLRRDQRLGQHRRLIRIAAGNLTKVNADVVVLGPSQLF